MQYCPKCGAEYRDDIQICADCDVELVNDMPPEIPEDYQDVEWVELIAFPGSLYAQMAVEMLHREGIPAYYQSIFGGSSLGMQGGADYLGANAVVWVLEPDVETANDILEPMVDEIPRDDYEDYEE